MTCSDALLLSSFYNYFILTGTLKIFDMKFTKKEGRMTAVPVELGVREKVKALGKFMVTGIDWGVLWDATVSHTPCTHI